MTREEAMEALSVLKIYDAQWLREAVDMAIEALEHEPSCRNTRQVDLTAQPDKRTDKHTGTHACDLIDRQALMKEFSDFVRVSNNSDFAPTPTWNDAVSLVGSMPSAQSTMGQVFDDDCVSRQAAIEALDQDVMGGLNYRRILRLLPSDRPTGHWIETEHSTNENGFKKWIEIRCPFCGHEPVYENIDDMNFCPNCGARMESDEE